MHIKANCKINLFLDVEKKRKDGYHDIVTVFQEISLADEIWIRLISRDAVLVQTELSEISGVNNIAFKVADYLKKKYGVRSGAEIVIKKNVPLGSGLGGGSADAGSVLKALNLLWNLRLTDREMLETAAIFGSDIPFFIKGGTALGEGRGEILTPLKLPRKCHFVLAYPDISVSTREIYEKADFKLTKRGKINMINQLKKNISKGKIKEVLFNRLEEVAFDCHPALAEIKDFFIENGAGAVMTGSGSSVFALTGSVKEAADLLRKFRKEYNFPVWTVETVN